MDSKPFPAASKSAPPRRTGFLVAGAALLAILGAGAFYYASTLARVKTAGKLVTVTITAGSCSPNEVEAEAGRTTFEIINASDRTVEWEILDGAMVLEERENIAPGLRSMLTTRLTPGAYQMTCGLLNNPRGKLVVTPSAASRAEDAHPQVAAFIGPLAEYQVALALDSGNLVEATQALDAALNAGDLARARGLYQPAQTSYLRLEPAAARFADLSRAINADAAFFNKREDDPAFSGFHRIEYGLFVKNSTEGLGPVADKLVADVTELKGQLHGLRLAPEDLAGGAARQLERAADKAATPGTGGDGPDSLAYFETNLATAAKSVNLLRPLAAKAAPGAVAEIDAAMAASKDSLEALKASAASGAGSAAIGAAYQALARDLRTLAAQIGKLNSAIGLA